LGRIPGKGGCPSRVRRDLVTRNPVGFLERWQCRAGVKHSTCSRRIRLWNLEGIGETRRDEGTIDAKLKFLVLP